LPSSERALESSSQYTSSSEATSNWINLHANTVNCYV
jgi:hypothetical protein